MCRLHRFIVMAAVIAAAASAVSPANAWTETPAPAPQAPKAEALPGISIEQTPSAQLQDDQTEITIPGIGSVGVLPKMDFGLDLLYGAQPDEKQDAVPKDDDVIIRGTLKHRF